MTTQSPGAARGRSANLSTPDDRNEDLGYSPDDAPESQGATADTGYGRDEQGSFGDESFDPSYGSPATGEAELERAERGADTPGEIDWAEAEGDAAQSVANEERDVATGDLSALEEVPKVTSWSGDEGMPARSDDAIREEIEDTLALFDEGVDVAVDVVEGEVVLTGSVDRDALRDAIDRVVQSVEAVRSIDNRIRVAS